MSSRKTAVIQACELMGQLKAKMTRAEKVLVNEGNDRTRPTYEPSEDAVRAVIRELDGEWGEIRARLMAACEIEVPVEVKEEEEELGRGSVE